MTTRVLDWIAAAVLLVFLTAVTVFADDEAPPTEFPSLDFPIVMTGTNGQGLYYAPEIIYHSAGLPATSVAYFGPSDVARGSTNLGAPSTPWHMVYADRFIAKGQPGINRTLTLPGGCRLVIQGGIIVDVQNLVVNGSGC